MSYNANGYEMNYNANGYNNQEKEEQQPPRCYKSLYMITHLIISLFAIYLSWHCNDGFNLFAFIVALFCPHLYIIWALATRGGCGIFNDTCVVQPLRRINL